MSHQEDVVHIQILQVPGCANVDRVRETVQRVLAWVLINAEVEDLVGDYPSPTVLVNGVDVTGRQLSATASCRLDLPNEQQLLTALGMSQTNGPKPVEEDVRTAAFRRLLRSGDPAGVKEVAADLGRPPEEIQSIVAELDRRGSLRLDGEGRITGSAGLSVEPDRHQIDIAGRRFWTWCAWDILGIFGALRATGTAVSRSPVGDEPLEVAFVRGHPQATDLVVFRPDESWRNCCSNVYEEWCPNSNFFQGSGVARDWASKRGLTGAVLPLAEACEVATSDWQEVVGDVSPDAGAESAGSHVSGAGCLSLPPLAGESGECRLKPSHSENL